MTFSCHFPGCVVQLSSEQAWVPSIQAIRQSIGKPVTAAEMLTDRTVCGRHQRVLREEGKRNRIKVLMFRYLETVDVLETRARERAEESAAAKGLLNLYGAFKAAGLAGPPKKENANPSPA